MAFLLNMGYQQVLSDRVLKCLPLIKKPTTVEIRKQRTSNSMENVGTNFQDICEKLNISMYSLRRLMRKELYGLVGVFYNELMWATESKIILGDADLGDLNNVSNETRRKAEQAEKDGFDIKIEAYKYSDSDKYIGVKKIPRKSYLKQAGLYIPESIACAIENIDPDDEPLFNLDIKSESLVVLDHILKRSIQLREKHGKNWYPIFSDQSISRHTGIDEKQVMLATSDLVGILCESYKMPFLCVWYKRYFLPSSKFAAAKELMN